MIMNIATILTCFNRKEKTIQCLRHLFASADLYNAEHRDEESINLSIYLTDDGCTDGTADAVREYFSNAELHIIQGNGHCYWAGGMRLAWEEALKEKRKWAFYLLVNDDTYVNKNCFFLLFEAHRYSIKTQGRPGIYSGITCDTKDKNRITYGGYIWTHYITGRDQILKPNGKPQKCDKANSNIMLIDASIVSIIGIFHNGYRHSAADYDYSMQAIKKGIPVLVTSKICGVCEYDHNSEKQIKEKLLKMNFKQRKEYFNNPIHCIHDTLLHKKRNMPQRYIMGWLGCYLKLYFPKFYYFLSDIRN